MTKMVAVVPVREGSQRVKAKNFRPFIGDKSLLDVKLEQLKQANCFDRIYVSSDSPIARETAERHEVGFLERSAEMCSNTTRWAGVIHYVAQTIPDEDCHVAWCHTTSPLFVRYAEAVAAFRTAEAEGHDSLVAVRPFNEFLLRANGRPFNYHWGHWHDYSQDLEPLFLVTGALFIARRADILKWHYLIGLKPFFFETAKVEAVDVDEEQDFEIAQDLYQVMSRAGEAGPRRS
jgi:N-acylneuraminate cytidylyltransferase